MSEDTYIQRQGLITRDELTARVRGIVGRDFIINLLLQSATYSAGVRSMLVGFAEVGGLAGWRWRLARSVAALPVWIPQSLMALNAARKKWSGAGK